MRISANDYAKEGNEPKDFILLLTPLKDLIDCLHISIGGTIGSVLIDKDTQIFPGYQRRACEIIKNGLKDIPCISGGLITQVIMAR